MLDDNYWRKYQTMGYTRSSIYVCSSYDFSHAHTPYKGTILAEHIAYSYTKRTIRLASMRRVSSDFYIHTTPTAPNRLINPLKANLNPPNRPYEGLDTTNQNNRKLYVFDRKLEGKHSKLQCFIYQIILGKAK